MPTTGRSSIAWRIAHRLGERPAQIQREIRIAVVGGRCGRGRALFSVLMPACYAAAATRATRGGSDAGNSAGPYASPRGGAGFATLSLLAQRSDLLQMTCELLGKLLPLRSGRLRRCAPGNCFAVLREIASLRSGRLLRCPRNDTINRATGDATPDRQPTVSDTPHRAPTVSVPPLGEPRRQKLHLTHTGLPNHLGQIDQVVDRLEQIPQQPRRRYPEQTGDVVVAVIEHAMRDATR